MNETLYDPAPIPAPVPILGDDTLTLQFVYSDIVVIDVKRPGEAVAEVWLTVEEMEEMLRLTRLWYPAEPLVS